MSAPRVAIVGARRVRQGLGPFVARDLVAAGAEVPCFLVTRESSIEPARRDIERHAGVSPRGYLDADAMIEAESLDALAILSPAETHEEHLAFAAERGLAALCEKPLLWGGAELAARAAARVRAFEASDLLLYENCQWPFTLPGFARLHPGSLDAPPRRFRMELQPASRGLQALGDSLSHPLSVLQALLPGEAPALSDVVFDPRPAGLPTGSLNLRFDYHSGGCTCGVEVLLVAGETLPRRAALEIDGRLARRVVEPESYRLFLAASERRVPLDDPLTELVTDFCRRLRAPEPGERRARARQIEQRMRLLAELAHAHAEEELT